MTPQNRPDRDRPDLEFGHTKRGTVVIRNPAERTEWIESTTSVDLGAWV